MKNENKEHPALTMIKRKSKPCASCEFMNQNCSMKMKSISPKETRKKRKSIVDDTIGIISACSKKDY